MKLAIDSDKQEDGERVVHLERIEWWSEVVKGRVRLSNRLLAGIMAGAGLCLLCLVGGGRVEASDRGHRLSERLWLDREIEDKDPLLLYERRLPLAFVAGYAYRDPRYGPRSVCGSIGGVTSVTGFPSFIHSGECAPLWPSRGSVRPAGGGQLIEGFLHGHFRSENIGLMLTAPTVHLLRLEFAEGQRLGVGIRFVKPANAHRAHLPAFGYAEYRFPRAVCVRKVEALDALGTVLGIAEYPLCKGPLLGTSR